MLKSSLLFLRDFLFLSLFPTLRTNQSGQRYQRDGQDVNEPIHSIPRSDAFLELDQMKRRGQIEQTKVRLR